MTPLSHESKELEQIYGRRFDDHIAYRNDVWKVLTSKFFSRYIDSSASVLDLGCGYGQFINNIRCGKKYAMDLNPKAKQFISTDVHFIEQDCSSTWELPDQSLDSVFTSNFFEHLASKASLASTIAQARRCLRPGGRLIAMGPNVKFIGGAYWDFWDHHLALTDVSLKELFDLQGFQVEKVIDRFLPYTMVNKRQLPMLLVSSYLHLPFAWKVFGKQFLLIARKPA
jgi:SAM-dependent methyltransferase